MVALLDLISDTEKVYELAFGSEQRADGSQVTALDKLRRLDERTFRNFFAPFVAPPLREAPQAGTR